MKQISRLFILASVIAAILFSSGCYDIRELDRVSIVTGLAVDKAEQPGNIELTIQIGKAGALGGGENVGAPDEKPVQLIDAVGESVMVALESLRNDNSRILFFQHNQVLIIGEDQARTGIIPYLDTFMRNKESRFEVWVLVSEGNAKDVLETEMELDEVSAVGIAKMIKNHAETSKSLGVRLLDFLSKITERSASAVAPIIKIIKEEDIHRLSLSGLAVFKKGQMTGKLTEDQSIGFSWVMGDLKGGNLSVETEKGSAQLAVMSSSSKLKPVFNKDRLQKMKADITGKFIIAELTGFKNMKIEQVIDLLKKGAADSIKKQVMDCYKKAQQLKSDIYGFGSYIYKYHAGRWKTIEKDWDAVFSNLALEVDIKVDIQDTGKTGKSPEMEGIR